MRLVNLLATALDKSQDWHLTTLGVEPRYLKLNFLPFLMDKYVSASLAHQMQLVWSASVVLALAAAVKLTLLCLLFEAAERAPKSHRPLKPAIAGEGQNTDREFLQPFNQ